VGDHVTTADCHAFPFLWRIETEFGLADYPKLQSWLDRCSQQPAFQKTIQPSWWWWW
jgi:glutathione S-transferase